MSDMITKNNTKDDRGEICMQGNIEEYIAEKEARESPSGAAGNENRS